DQHPAQAVSDPVDAVAAGGRLDVVEHGGDVVADDLVDVPVAFADFGQEGLADVLVDSPDRADLGALARASEIEEEDLVAPSQELRGEVRVRVGDRPEGA